jgi:hypothetical protein
MIAPKIHNPLDPYGGTLKAFVPVDSIVNAEEQLDYDSPGPKHENKSTPA